MSDIYDQFEELQLEMNLAWDRIKNDPELARMNAAIKTATKFGFNRGYCECRRDMDSKAPIHEAVADPIAAELRALRELLGERLPDRRERLIAAALAGNSTTNTMITDLIARSINDADAVIAALKREKADEHR